MGLGGRATAKGFGGVTDVGDGAGEGGFWAGVFGTEETIHDGEMVVGDLRSSCVVDGRRLLCFRKPAAE